MGSRGITGRESGGGGGGPGVRAGRVRIASRAVSGHAQAAGRRHMGHPSQ